MPKALSGEMLADPFVPIDRPEHHSFNRRVKATAPKQRASGATLRSILPQAAAILEKESMAARDHITRVDPSSDPRHKILRFIAESMSFHGVAIGRAKAEAKARAVFEYCARAQRRDLSSDG
jgi:hypothetical protein